MRYANLPFNPFHFALAVLATACIAPAHAVTFEPGDILTAPALTKIDPVTGVATSLEEVAIDAKVEPGGTVLFTAYSEEDDGVQIRRLDPETGEITLIASGAAPGQDPLPLDTHGVGQRIALDAFHGYVYVGNTGLVRVDLDTGEQVLISDGGEFPDPEFPQFDSVVNMALDGLGNAVIGTRDKIFRVDLETGAQELAGPAGVAWYGMVVEPTGDIVINQSDDLVRIDAETGQSTPIAVNDPEFLLSGFTLGLGLEVDGSILVSDFWFQRLNRVDATSGDVSVLYEGPNLVNVWGVDVYTTACSDGLDNDGDGLVDLDDSNCSDAHDNNEHPQCSDGLDNDGDGHVDYPDDPGCRNADYDIENPECDDDFDNDNDGKVDWDGGAQGGFADPGCTSAWRDDERKRNCGLGFEVAFGLLAAAALRKRRGARA